VWGGGGNDVLYGNAGNDQLQGQLGNDYLSGGAGNDTLYGQENADRLRGDAGSDILTGGTGADVFDFATVSDSGITITTRDTITDFSYLESDKIDLSLIDANTTTALNDVFSILNVGTAVSFAYTNALYFDVTTQILYGNINNNAAADFSILLTGVTSLILSDFIL
jgi:Ca2+-binding RTX toxin-like protein